MVVAVVLVAALCAVGALALPRVGGGGSFEVERADRSASAVKVATGAKGTAADEDEEGSGGSDDAAASPSQKTVRSTAQRSVVVVHVDGAVRVPGVYELRSAMPRVDDAVRAAGGLRDDADTTSVNLASVVSDGQKVHIPAEGEEVPTEDGQEGSGAAGAATGAAAAAGAQAQDGAKVNINTADEAELQRLPGVGEATARAIVEDRRNNGAFSTPEDLMRVSGIGEKKFERMRSMVCV